MYTIYRQSYSPVDACTSIEGMIDVISIAQTNKTEMYFILTLFLFFLSALFHFEENLYDIFFSPDFNHKGKIEKD